MMDRRAFIAGGVSVLATLLAADVAAGSKSISSWRADAWRAPASVVIPRPPACCPRLLRELGYVEGQNIVIEQPIR